VAANGRSLKKQKNKKKPEKNKNQFKFEKNSTYPPLAGEACYRSLMSTHASVLVDSVGPPSAEVCRTAVSFS
jgi:hypothetical protein